MPTPSRVIWFISHRQHYDPRIYNIMSVYRARGWETVLFDPPADQESSMEWAELVTPEWSPVPPLDPRIADVQTASSIVQEFLANLPAVSHTTLQRAGKIVYQWASHWDTPLLSFQEDEGTFRYTYNPSSNTLWSVPTGHSLSELIALSLQSGKPSDAELAGLMAKIPDFIFRETDDDYILTRPGSHEPGEELAIDKISRLVRRRALPRHHCYEQDELLGNRFDYTAFKRTIYDYTYELDLVKGYLGSPKHRRPDAVLVSDLPVLPIGLMLKDIFDCKLIVDCHEWWAEQERIWYPNATKKIDEIDVWERKLYARCDAALTVGKMLARDMGKHFGRQFHYVPTCVFDLPGLPNRDPHFWQERANLPEGASVVLFQGGLSTNRNLDTLMRATRYFAEGQYLVVCGDGAYREEMEAILTAEGRPDRVRMLGWRPQLDLWEFTAHADLGIIPYTHRLRYYQLSAPNKLSEYHVCELPILADHDMIELARIVKEDKIGRVTDLSRPKVMGETIAAMLADKSSLAEFRAAYMKAGKRFTRSQCDVYLNPVVEAV